MHRYEKYVIHCTHAAGTKCNALVWICVKKSFITIRTFTFKIQTKALAINGSNINNFVSLTSVVQCSNLQGYNDTYFTAMAVSLLLLSLTFFSRLIVLIHILRKQDLLIQQQRYNTPRTTSNFYLSKHRRLRKKNVSPFAHPTCPSLHPSKQPTCFINNYSHKKTARNKQIKHPDPLKSPSHPHLTRETQP